MDEYDRDADLTQSDPGKAADAARMVRRDFTALLLVLDQQLARLSSNEADRRLHIAEARIAAERGLTLSEQLIDMLQAKGGN